MDPPTWGDVCGVLGKEKRDRGGQKASTIQRYLRVFTKTPDSPAHAGNYKSNNDSNNNKGNKNNNKQALLGALVSIITSNISCLLKILFEQ